MMGTYFATRVENKRKQKTDLANFHEGMKLAENDMAEAQELELRQLRRLYPSTAECVDAAMNRNGALWCRQPEHPEFLQVRLGIGSVRALHQFKASQRRGLVALQRQQTQLREKYRLIHEAPIAADLRSVGGLGIAGSSANLIEIARGLIFQVAALHSPAEVVLTCLTSTDNKPHWSWLEWLPHTSSSHRPIEGPCLAGDGPSGRALLDQLEDLIDLRAEGDEPALRGPLKSGENTPAPVVPAVIVLVHEAAVDLAQVAHLAERGPDVGVYVVWVAGDRHQFPAACRTFVELQSNGEALIGMVRSERVFASVSTEAVDLETAHALARTMSPLVDASSPVKDESDLPRMVSVVGLLGSSVDDPEQVLSRWQDNGSYVNRSAPAVPRERAGDLRAIVGHAGLEPFTIDLRSQGPHALVGGLPTLGLEDQSLGPIGFEPQGVYLLAGPPKSGVSSLVRWLAQSMANTHPQVPRILLTARPSPLAKLPLWTAAITGPDRVQDYINNQLKPYLTTEAEPGQPRVAVFVEQFSELAVPSRTRRWRRR